MKKLFNLAVFTLGGIFTLTVGVINSPQEFHWLLNVLLGIFFLNEARDIRSNNQ